MSQGLPGPPPLSWQNQYSFTQGCCRQHNLATSHFDQSCRQSISCNISHFHSILLKRNFWFLGSKYPPPPLDVLVSPPFEVPSPIPGGFSFSIWILAQKAKSSHFSRFYCYSSLFLEHRTFGGLFNWIHSAQIGYSFEFQPRFVCFNSRPGGFSPGYKRLFVT